MHNVFWVDACPKIGISVPVVGSNYILVMLGRSVSCTAAWNWSRRRWYIGTPAPAAASGSLRLAAKTFLSSALNMI